MTRVLLACSDQCFLKWSRSPFVGRLLTPVLKTCRLWHEYTAADNFAYANWDPVKFRQMLLEYSMLVHIGRVNSVERILKFLGVADSFDGLSYSKYNRVHLPRILKLLKEHHETRTLQGR
jgi:hypothetical protein